ncbi:MAG: sugar phosphate isomerase/epimerase [Acidobacteriales bacterium]|nr:sugar phosphate isomerase/epimerase [Terriglobales bacterium]
MRRAMSTFVDVKQRLHSATLDRLARGGAQAIEIFCAKEHFDYTDRAHIRELGDWFRSSPVELHSLHAPLFADDWGRSGSPPLNLAGAGKRERIDSMDEIKRALEVAENLPFRYLIQHLGTPGEGHDERKFDATLSAVEHLRAFAKPLGVMVLVENIPNELSTAERLMALLRAGHFTDVGVCFDLGHAHMTEGLAGEFAILKDHIRSTHVHDNKADRDAHLWPGEGTMDWAAAMRLLRSAPHVPPLLMEIEGLDGVDIPARMAQAYTLMEKAAE